MTIYGRLKSVEKRLNELHIQQKVFIFEGWEEYHRAQQNGHIGFDDVVIIDDVPEGSAC